MEREQVRAGLIAYKRIDAEIEWQQKILPEMPEDEQPTCLEQAEKLKRVKKGILLALNGLPFLQRDSIWRHYVLGEQWEYVCRKHSYSERAIRTIANKGLDTLEQVFENNTEIREFCCQICDQHTSIPRK
jgi:DNA-directed RNA polymerase specialized sigma24 family protein